MHALETVNDHYEGTVCQQFMTRLGDLDHFVGHRTDDLVTCVFCLAARWKDY